MISMELELCLSFIIETPLNKRLLTNPLNDNFPRRNSDFKWTLSTIGKRNKTDVDYTNQRCYLEAEVNKALETCVDKVDYNQGST